MNDISRTIACRSSLSIEPVHLPNWQRLALCSTAEARAVIPFQIARELAALPLALFRASDGDSLLTVVLPAPLTAESVRAVKFASGCEIVAEEQPRALLEKALTAAYQDQTLNSALTSLPQQQPNPSPCDEVVGQPIPNLLNELLTTAIARRASDIHLEPAGEQYRLRLRIDGLLQEAVAAPLAFSVGEQLVRRIKILSQLEIAGCQGPQDGGFSYSNPPWTARVRVSVLPQYAGEKVVLRLLENGLDEFSDSQAAALGALGLAPEQERCLRACLAADSGCIILAGPTGSGKSTLLYAALCELNTGWRNITTLEDPVERLLSGINQVQIEPQFGRDYAALLPALLRQDPDVIMIGEIRDAVTAETALTAALVGRLVLTTVHAANALEVFTRLRQLGVANELLAGALRLVVAQRLVPLNCTSCIRPAPLNEALQRVFNLPPQTVVQESRGCPQCRQQGYHGRRGIFELLPCTELLRAEISRDRGANALRETAHECGYLPYAHQVREALLRGAISPFFALRALGISSDVLGGKNQHPEVVTAA